MFKASSILAVAILAAYDLDDTAATPGDSAQVNAVREMSKVLKTRRWEKFYRDYCHPNIHKQATTDEFTEFMDSEKGKEILALFDQVLKAIDAKADKSVLISRSISGEEHEFVLVKVKETPESDRKGQQWHLELKLDKGNWKLLDTD